MEFRYRFLFVLLACKACAAPPPEPPPPPVPSSPDGVRVAYQERFYDVEGASPASIEHSLALHGPTWRGRAAHAMTDWGLRWNYAPAQTPDGCRAHRPRVVLEIVTTLPRWNGGRRLPPGLSDPWGSFVLALRYHEAVHREIVIESGAEVVRRLNGLSASTCGALAGLAEEVVASVHEQFEERHRRFDADSEHMIQPTWRRPRPHPVPRFVTPP